MCETVDGWKVTKIERFFLQYAVYSSCDSSVPCFGLTVGYQTIACPESMVGTNFRAMEEEVKKKVDAYANELLSSHEEYKNAGVY